MPKKPRDTMTYDLKRGNEVVYRGTTNDPEQRKREHEQSGKQFDRLKVTSIKMTEYGAMKKETESLERYRRGHDGKNPLYNKDDDG